MTVRDLWNALTQPSVWLPLVVGIVVGGAITAVVGYWGIWRTTQEKRPAYVTRNLVVVAKDRITLADLTILHKGDSQPISTASITDIVFWNRGRGAIQTGDIGRDERLCIAAKDPVKILSVQTLDQSRKENAVECELDPAQKNIANVTFRILARHQGALIRVVHTGTKLGDIEMRGTIEGQELGPTREVMKWRIENASLFPLMFGVVLAGGLSFYFDSIRHRLEAGLVNGLPDFVVGTIDVLSLILFFAIAFYIFLQVGRLLFVYAFPINPIPRQLRHGLFTLREEFADEALAATSNRKP